MWTAGYDGEVREWDTSAWSELRRFGKVSQPINDIALSADGALLATACDDQGVRVYDQAETENETRGQWYVRQLNGSANIEGNRWLHVLTGHLSHQIEHHLFPDIPAARYPEMAPRVREICERYEQAYNTGSFRRQLSSVIGRILRLSLPGPMVAGLAHE